MEQALSIYLPQWDIQRHRRLSPRAHDAPPADAPGNTRPLLLVRSTARLETVARCCPIARVLGVTPGMSLADARAACGAEVDVAPFDPDKSLHALHRLARWMARFSPAVALDPNARQAGPPGSPSEPPDGLLVDMTGVAHLFGGEQLLLTEIATRLARRGIASRLAIAPTIGAAWALARFAPDALTVCHECHLLIENRESKTERPGAPVIENVLDPLPTPALRLSGEIVAQLHSVGIDTIGQLRILAREGLLHRFGSQVLLRLDQAFGRVPELLVPLRHYDPIAVTQPFDGPTLALEGIFLRLQDMLTRLADLLLRQEAGVRGLRLCWVRLNAPPVTRELVTAAATRDPRHLWKLLRPKVETMHLGYGVEAMTLTAFWMQAMPHRQAGIWHADRTDEDRALDEFLDTVLNRWGPHSRRVLTPAPAASHVPEEAWCFTPLGGKDASGDKDIHHSSFSLPALDRPSVLLTPQPIEVLALQPDFPPVRVHWRGQWHPVLAASGPERIATPWWRVPPHAVRSVTRDYYKVQTPLGWLAIFRQTPGKWFVHGLWA